MKTKDPERRRIQQREATRRYRAKNKEKCNETNREWRSRNPEYIKRYSKRINDERVEIKKELMRIRGSKCEDCGIEYNGKNIAIFEFHHINPEEKEATFHKWISFQRALNEAAKCRLLCANCHRITHHGSG